METQIEEDKKKGGEQVLHTSFYAHSTVAVDQSDWQRLRDHLGSVAKLSGFFAARFDCTGLAYVAGLLHDLGKYTHEFQHRLNGGKQRAEHSIHGAHIAIEYYGKELGMMLAYAIAGHHTGLANGRSGGTRTPLKERLWANGVPRLLDAWKEEIALPEQVTVPPDFKPHPDPERLFFQLAFCTRMIFSCLVDADFLDTEAFYQKVEGKEKVLRGQYPALNELRTALDLYLEKIGQRNPDLPINLVRRTILTHVRKQATVCAPGLFSLTVPTGGGKTLASLAFALDHAIEHGLERVIYVIPYTSIVEQNARVFREAFGALGEAAVLEHHSVFEDEKIEGKDARDKLRLAMENWDFPVVVTTAVQFFESLFASKPSRCRKLHNIARSVVILDEAQTLPLKFLVPCVAAIDELARNYGSSIVLCTATQPALQYNPDDPANSFVGGLTGVQELAPEPQRLYETLRRVCVRHVGMLDDVALIERLFDHEQVLCIVNNRAHARALFKGIRHLPGAYHLTTAMCALHRRQKLDEIRAVLKAGQPCRLVATSLIEAGVDVDFPYVLRAEVGLDSIAQAAGRCNREGRHSWEISEVHIFAPADLWRPPPELKQYAGILSDILRRHADDPLTLAAIRDYFSELYWQKGPHALDKENIIGLFHEGKWDGLPFDDVSDRFRIIENRQRTVIVPFDDVAKGLLEELRYVPYPGERARKLQLYTVQVPYQAFDELVKYGAVQPVREERFGRQFMELVNESLYDAVSGLDWENPVFIETDKLFM